MDAIRSRLPRALAEAIAGEHGFKFSWLVATLLIAAAIGAIVAVLVLPVAALLGLIAVGIWNLANRSSDDEDDEREPGHRPDLAASAA
jgi:hypothetical protein